MGINKKAIVTIAIGEDHYRRWKTYCEANWKEYADKYGYDLICFSSALDVSLRAQKRSPTWQKCLILVNTACKEYERVVWVDSDILINNRKAPDIIEQIPVDKIGGINACFFHSEGDFLALQHLYMKLWKQHAIPFVEEWTPREYYQNYGIETDLNEVMQAGVLAMSPHYHGKLLEQVYYNYEDRSGAHWHGEMRPLSYEIIKSGKYAYIDGRFNFLFHHFWALFYPELFSRMIGFSNSEARKIGRVLYRFKDEFELNKVTKSAFSESFFLHFAGCPRQELLLRQAFRLTHA